MVGSSSPVWMRTVRTDVDFVPKKLRLPSKVCDRPEDGIKRGVQMFSEVFGEETEDMAAVFLKQGILPPVTAIGGGLG